MALTKVDGSLLSGSISAATLPTSQLSGTVTSSQIASITSSQVTTALGYTPYNASNPSGYGTVTSVATGNGLSGGTITTSGTLTVACPTFNTVGSYCMLAYQWVQDSTYTPISSGDNRSAGVYMQSLILGVGLLNYLRTNNLSGTWKWMAGNFNVSDWETSLVVGIACRVA